MKEEMDAIDQVIGHSGLKPAWLKLKGIHCMGLYSHLQASICIPESLYYMDRHCVLEKQPGKADC